MHDTLPCFQPVQAALLPAGPGIPTQQHICPPSSASRLVCGPGPCSNTVLPWMQVVAATGSGVASFALCRDGAVFAFGSSKRGQLGLGPGVRHTTDPQQLCLPAAATQVSAGWGHAAALLGETGKGGSARCTATWLRGAAIDSFVSKFWSLHPILFESHLWRMCLAIEFKMIVACVECHLPGMHAVRRRPAAEGGSLWTWGWPASGRLGHTFAASGGAGLLAAPLAC